MNVPEHFFPTLPIVIPASQGTALWWWISWWIFQIVVMGAIIWVVTRWAMKIDRLMNKQSDPKSTPTDPGSSING